MGRQEAGWVDYVVVIPGCETSWSGTKVSFTHILRTFLGYFTRVSGGVDSCGGWWILGHSCMICSAVTSPIPQFIQIVSTVHPILCSQYLSSEWWPLPRQPIVVCSFLDNFSAVNLLYFHAMHPANSFMGDFHLMVAFAES